MNEMGRRGSGAGACGACKLLRRKCVKWECVFAPYFHSDEAGTAHFAAVHRVFGASNASKLLHRLPPHKRLDAVVTLCYQALARLADPVYGCVSHIFTLQHQVVHLQEEVALVQARLQSLMLQQTTTHLPYFDDPMAPVMAAVTTPTPACMSDRYLRSSSHPH